MVPMGETTCDDRKRFHFASLVSLSLPPCTRRYSAAPLTSCPTPEDHCTKGRWMTTKAGCYQKSILSYRSTPVSATKDAGSRGLGYFAIVAHPRDGSSPLET
ncbi:hypothetical protein G6F46_006375 [Rhizopus delemar]|uniref:Uncharacterized protein n=2 Tax=Rhizopus TaxID=4842 RepID=A0A9P6ZE39_9FUNG|nr:hypothetical protein G6F36_013209 [Rhizopus arrhizus]KAG1447983.1 hypothetical protein G6F55_010860 [Rhizopus delemar]KAG1497566.1 hypothetical protein G6F54_005673 [Rhizopus delemar]KAG1511333.1 hypothetical protein G6F53_006016 [Rhizopus delemar]KAG1526583.1 hypothetical protein G6F52_002304 [Rhizopus delemar]